MASPQVSIIINTYNDAAYVGQAVDSVLSQTHTDWELVIYSNASTDETARVVGNYQDARIFFYESGRHTNLSEARNQALQLVVGKYVCFLDSDDSWVSTKLAEQVAFMEGKRVDLCATNFFLVEQNRTRQAFSPKALAMSEVNKYIEINYPVALSTLMFHKSILAANPFNPETHITGDYQLVTKLAWEGRFELLPEALVYLTIREESESSRKSLIMVRELIAYATQLRSQGLRLRGDLVLLRALEVAFTKLGLLGTLKFVRTVPLTWPTMRALPHYFAARISFRTTNYM